MLLFGSFKKSKDNAQQKKKTQFKNTTIEYLDDITFIQDMKHIDSTPWHQYDVLLASRGYGWEFMIDWADYMAKNDLDSISEVIVGELGGEKHVITEQFQQNGNNLSGLNEVATERSMLSIAGFSNILKAPMKIVFFNQTRAIRLFTHVDDEDLIKKYTETVIRRSFGTENAMKLGKPLTKRRRIKFDFYKIAGYFLMAFSATCLTGGIINNFKDYTALGFIFGAGVFGSILAFRDKIHLILKPYADSLVLKIQNSIVLNRMIKFFTVICGLSLIGFLILGPLGFEVPAIVCVVTTLITMIPFYGSIFLNCGFFGFQRTIVWFNGQSIYISSKKLLQWLKKSPSNKTFETLGAVQLKGKEPVISLYEDNIKTREYRLQTEGDEDFNKKYFLLSVRLSIIGNPQVPVVQIDGFISDTPKNRRMTMNDVGYRMEGHFLACGGEISKQYLEKTIGQDLQAKGLKYPGYTTPTNIRLIGICPECGKSFAFHGYAFYMTQSDVAYSDDGLDVCEIVAYDIDKETWSYETDGKIFRYYNSFNCPHCRTPYIDYKNYPENKVFGVSGCVLLGKKHYKAE